jgi:hypothetical protein
MRMLRNDYRNVISIYQEGEYRIIIFILIALNRKIIILICPQSCTHLPERTTHVIPRLMHNLIKFFAYPPKEMHTSCAQRILGVLMVFYLVNPSG